MRAVAVTIAVITGGGMTLAAEENPFFKPFDTPFSVPPFERIRTEHYRPAFKQALADHKAEVEAIASRAEPPTFANTVVALERSGAFLDRVASAFDVLNESMTSDAMQEIADELAPLRARHTDDILMNAALFARIRALWDGRGALGLDREDVRLLERTYKDFVRGGAALEGAPKERLRRINEDLAQLTLRYANNILAENNDFVLMLENKEDLAGLPEGSLDAAAETAKARGQTGKWAFTLDKPSLIPFLQYSSRRELRERMFKAYVERCNHDDESDNKALASRIAALRAERAKLLGYATHAAWVLDDAMAKTPEQTLDFLKRLWPPALAVAKREAAEYREMIRREGGTFGLAPWDWFYYATKVQKERYALDDEALRPFFKLENVIDGAFGVATRLWGIRFVERPELPKYHPDVRVYEVTEREGGHIGILYVDYFPRQSKRGGAWMNGFRGQSIVAGKRVAPIITNNGNFTKPTREKPSLLTLEEVQTLFHEFGHALHGLLANGRYERLSGTAVAIDFVELPSQIMENWAVEPEVLRIYARHFQTGEPMPVELAERIRKAQLFNQGFATVEYLAASFLDLDYHTLAPGHGPSIPGFERRSMAALALIPEIVPRYRSTYFNHIFGSADYAAAYYSYIWAEVLDADAFEAFKEKGLFDQATAAAYRRHILERGNSEEPMELYKAFRGAEPKVEPLLKRRGLM
jgi:peptidyl-dipeptidase Dcp